jgi:hypothetical protein
MESQKNQRLNKAMKKVVVKVASYGLHDGVNMTLW